MNGIHYLQSCVNVSSVNMFKNKIDSIADYGTSGAHLMTFLIAFYQNMGRSVIEGSLHV